MFLQKMSPADRFANMALLPISYLTAIYAFMHVAHLSKGETVLIQSATTCQGLATLQVARHLGAEIFATVDDPGKSRILEQDFGIPGGRIFSSGERFVVSELMKATENNGIDVILSCGEGEHMHEIWRCVAPMGRFIQVGRTNISAHDNLSMEFFQRNATFSSIDVESILEKKPEFGAR